MLVLSRKQNESIVINDNITIMVVEIRGDKVRLGIEAPKEVPVHRKEIYEKVKDAERRTQDGSDSSICTLNSSLELPITKIVGGIKTTFIDQDDDWDSTEGDRASEMINEGCPNTEEEIT